MDWHFGYNCRHYIPTLGKCRVLIVRYNKRADLLADKWLDTRDILLYTECSPQELIGQVKRGEVEARYVKKDGSWKFRTRCPWAWDNCALSDTGGQCFYFEPHDGKKITCLMDLRQLDAEHPNLEKVPSDDDVRIVEDTLPDLRVQGWSVPKQAPHRPGG